MRTRPSPVFISLTLGLLVATLITVTAIWANTRPLPSSFEIPVPYVSQVPDGEWVAPWDEACEEASLAMIQSYYSNGNMPAAKETRGFMQDMIDWENKTFKKYDDTDAVETLRLIYEKTDMLAYIKRDPTVEDIKKEIARKHPVIAMVNMYQFYDEPNLGDSFHVFVITGYDDAQKEFIVNDPARPQKRYSYDRLIGALHDFNPKSGEADGAPTVIFTAP